MLPWKRNRINTFANPICIRPYLFAGCKIVTCDECLKEQLIKAMVVTAIHYLTPIGIGAVVRNLLSGNPFALLNNSVKRYQKVDAQTAAPFEVLLTSTSTALNTFMEGFSCGV